MFVRRLKVMAGVPCLGLKMEAACFSEKSVSADMSTQCHNPVPKQHYFFAILCNNIFPSLFLSDLVFKTYAFFMRATCHARFILIIFGPDILPSAVLQCPQSVPCFLLCGHRFHAFAKQSVKLHFCVF
jgi:hypothetical protein